MDSLFEDEKEGPDETEGGTSSQMDLTKFPICSQEKKKTLETGAALKPLNTWLNVCLKIGNKHKSRCPLYIIVCANHLKTFIYLFMNEWII